MSVKRLHIEAPPDADKPSGCCGATSAETRSSASPISKTDTSASAPNIVGSHPGLLALARILGRSAARADLRRTRRGAVAIMGMTDAMLMVAAMIAITLVWSVILRLR